MKLVKEARGKEEGGGGGGSGGGGGGGEGEDHLPRGRTRERVMSHVVPMLLPRFAPIAKLLIAAILVLSCCANRFARASEFPERECCVFPLPEPTGRSTAAPIPTGRSGSDIKKGVAILNCLYARQLCFEDPSCSAILEIIPRVCGPELVACSTVTVTKCRSALHSLQAFSFFRPTCLCKERHVDPDCNSFQNFLFDHPCIDVQKKEKEQHPIEPLPTCTHAMNECLRGKPCNQVFENFKNSCKAREGKCRMESRDACHDSWTQLRLSPVFGCICPNNHIKKRCDRIFSLVNHNPCVVNEESKRVSALLRLGRPIGYGLGPLSIRPAAGELPGDLVTADQYVSLFSVPRDRAHLVPRLRNTVRRTRTGTSPSARPSSSARSPSGGTGKASQAQRVRRRRERSTEERFKQG
ncbi:uncharacterized protein LOC124425770 isoform X5 [Vespa crabro]|uniref:uncharacterized protein LOC124425770 isoform X5 n=1 Tax=Vespa crabro TaxID=7445 RepID=UPI001F01D0EB|nr:uncharacterized protein LOC124425770 isoform X5 [Vespa crabro]